MDDNYDIEDSNSIIEPNNQVKRIGKRAFKNCENLIKVSKTLLSAQETLPEGACASMFEGCKNLINAPVYWQLY